MSNGRVSRWVRYREGSGATEGWHAHAFYIPKRIKKGGLMRSSPGEEGGLRGASLTPRSTPPYKGADEQDHPSSLKN